MRFIHITLINKDFAPGTIERYVTSLKHTQEFIKATYNKDDFFVEDINIQFVEDYEYYLKSTRQCGHNTTMKYLRNFHKIVRIAKRKGWITVDPFTEVSLTLKEVDRDFLELEELKKVIKKDIDIKRLDQVRDIFVFCCFTGLAFSDVKHLKKEHLVKDNDGQLWLRIARQKTKNMCNIPLRAKNIVVLHAMKGKKPLKPFDAKNIKDVPCGLSRSSSSVFRWSF